MEIRESVIKSLVESVRKRAQSDSKQIPIYHKNSPIGKFVSRGDHNSVIKTKKDTPNLEKIKSKGMYRGRVGRSKGIAYSFRPSLATKKDKIVHDKGTETGVHEYSFSTPNSSKATLRIRYAPIQSIGKNIKGIFNKSEIQVNVENSNKKDVDKKMESVYVIRGLMTALNHHMKAHRPGEITFKKDKSKLYKQMLKKIGGNAGKFTVKKSKDKNWGDDVYTLIRNSNVPPELQSAIKRATKKNK
jgi:hypothetical protein